MLVFIKVLASVYFLAVNLYGFLLIKFQRKKRVEDCKKQIKKENENIQIACENNKENQGKNTPQNNTLIDLKQKEDNSVTKDAITNSDKAQTKELIVHLETPMNSVRNFPFQPYQKKTRPSVVSCGEAPCG